MSIPVGLPLKAELRLDEALSTCAVKRSRISQDREWGNSNETLPTWVDLHWKWASYRIRREAEKLLSIEICNKKTGDTLKRDIWEHLTREIKLSIAHEIDNRRDVVGTQWHKSNFTHADFLACATEIYSSIHMLGNEQFIIIWSPAFLYIMSFDPAFRFEYDEVEFPKD